jgi:hypothetical protein
MEESTSGAANKSSASQTISLIIQGNYMQAVTAVCYIWHTIPKKSCTLLAAGIILW